MAYPQTGIPYPACQVAAEKALDWSLHCHLRVSAESCCFRVLCEPFQYSVGVVLYLPRVEQQAFSRLAARTPGETYLFCELAAPQEFPLEAAGGILELAPLAGHALAVPAIVRLASRLTLISPWRPSSAQSLLADLVHHHHPLQ